MRTIKSSRPDVDKFLQSMKEIINAPTFNIDTDMTLIKSKKSKEDIQYSTGYTMLDLDFENEDIINVLRTLEIEDYSETKLDRDDVDPPLLFVFGKFINSRELYIKIKIKVEKQHVVCVSFHYAKHKMHKPYA